MLHTTYKMTLQRDLDEFIKDLKKRGMSFPAFLKYMKGQSLPLNQQETLAGAMYYATQEMQIREKPVMRDSAYIRRILNLDHPEPERAPTTPDTDDPIPAQKTDAA